MSRILSHLPVALTAAALLLAVPLEASASCTSRTIAGTTYHNCAGGLSGTSREIGGTTYHQFGAQSGTSRSIGGTTHHQFGSTYGTSRNIGGTTYHSGTLFGQ